MRKTTRLALLATFAITFTAAGCSTDLRPADEFSVTSVPAAQDGTRSAQSSTSWCLTGNICTSTPSLGISIKTYSDSSSGLRTGFAAKNIHSFPILVSLRTTCDVGDSWSHTVALGAGKSISRHLDELGLGFCWRGTTTIRAYHPLNGSKLTALYFGSLRLSDGSYIVCNAEGTCWDL